jgi:polysaccharide chain length determinant protein (PEP-CTERM system associated)
MLPGKNYTPEDVVLILRRRFWLLVVPTVVVAAGAAAYARQLPNVFRSEALIYVEPQRVPEAYVRTNATRIEDRIAAIRQQILSRTKLEALIIELDLYPEIRRASVMEDAVERLRADITLAPRGDTLSVAASGRNPHLVQKIADKLSDLVINESMRNRENLTEGTDQFIEATLDDVRRRLAEQEKKLADYRQRFRGELPSQQEANLQAVQNFQMQLRAIADSMNNAQDRRLSVEKNIVDLENQAALSVESSLTTGSSAPTTTSQQLAQAKQQLDTLLRTFKPDHPEVKLLKARVAELDKKADAEALEAPVSAEAPPSAAEQLRRRRLSTARDELEQLNKNIAKMQKDEEEVRKRSTEYEQKLAAAPVRETELIELNRDYNQISATYSSYLTKREDSKIAASLERRSLGAQFRLLDQARLPLRPSSPNRRVYNLGGLAVGLALGVGLVGFLEYRDRTFKTDDEVATVLGLPVLAVVPVMESETDRKRAARRRWVLNLGLGGTALGCLAVLLYTLVR